jgi:hypothetical protein
MQVNVVGTLMFGAALAIAVAARSDWRRITRGAENDG